MTRKVASIVGHYFIHVRRPLPNALTVLFAVIVSAHSADSLAADPPFPFTGIVVADQTQVFAGASTNYYTVAKLKRGDLIQIHDNLFGWYKIDPPDGTYSLIAKEYVATTDGSTTGSVRGTRVRIKAPAPTGPDDSYRTQMLADQGLFVKILGDEGQYYKIVPPQGARLFIQSRDIAPATQQQIAAAQPATPPQLAEAQPTSSPTQRPAASVAESNAATPTAVATSNSEPVPTPQPLRTTPQAKPETAVASQNAAPPTSTNRTNRYPVDVAPQIPTATASTDTQAQAQPEPLADPEIESSTTEVAMLNRALDPPSTTSSAEIESHSPTETVTEVANEEANQDAIASTETHTPSPTAAEDVDHADTDTDVDANAQVAIATPTPAPSPAITLESIDDSAIPDSRLPVQPNHPELRTLEKKLVAIGDLPTIDQPLSAIRIAYERLATSRELTDRDAAIVKARLTQIEHQQKLQATLIDITVTQQSLNESQRQRDLHAASRAPEYLAVGKLSASSLYDGSKLPLLYRVTNPMNGLTIAYLRPSPDSPDLRNFVGQYIGVTGKQESTPGIKTSYIVPRNIDLLTADTATANR